MLLIFLKGKRGEKKNKNWRYKLPKWLPSSISSNRSKTEATRASRFLMRNCSKKNTMTHLIIMPFLPKVHITIPTSLAHGPSVQSYCNMERLPAPMSLSGQRGDRPPWCCGGQGAAWLHSFYPSPPQGGGFSLCPAWSGTAVLLCSHLFKNWGAKSSWLPCVQAERIPWQSRSE